MFNPPATAFDATVDTEVAALNAVSIGATTLASTYAGSAPKGPMDARVAAALAARIVALEQWSQRCDPDHDMHAESLIAAAARYRLSRGVDGIGFDPAGFAEFVLFIEEMPF